MQPSRIIYGSFMKTLLPFTNCLHRALGRSVSFFVLLLIAFIAISPIARAVIPAPDGGYAGGNTAEGQNALLDLTSGGYNTAVGYYSLANDTTGSDNTAIGAGALFANTGANNTALGIGALLFNTTGDQNTAIGVSALANNGNNVNNTAVGYNAAYHSGGGGCTAVGSRALFTATGLNNTAIGLDALRYSTTGMNNIALGASAGTNVTDASAVIAIGASGANVSNSCFIGNIRGYSTSINDAIPVLIDSNNQLGTQSSSRRFKKDIQQMDKASETILALKPVTFHYRSDKTNRAEFGLVAEEVAKVNPDLVVRDRNDEIYTVRYDAVNAMLLNEFLKEHRKVEEQGAIIAKQQKQIEALTTGLQKVNDRVNLMKPASQLAESAP